MAAKKAVNLSKLPFQELRDKVKEMEGVKSLNRFELTAAVRKAENLTAPEAKNPREIKPEIAALKSKLAETTDKKTRQELRKAVVLLKKETRKYL